MKKLIIIAGALLVLFLGALWARADDTGAKVTGTVESAGTWTDFTTTRLNTSDNSKATCGAPQTTCIGTLSDYSFGIPAGATINGIEVVAEVACSGLECSTAEDNSQLLVSLSWDNGTSQTSATSTTAGVLTATDATFTFGGATQTWGRTWSASEFADGTFMASTTAIGVNAGDAVVVDFHTITVYYTPAPADPGPGVRIGTGGGIQLGTGGGIILSQ